MFFSFCGELLNLYFIFQHLFNFDVYFPDTYLVPMSTLPTKSLCLKPKRRTVIFLCHLTSDAR